MMTKFPNFSCLSPKLPLVGILAFVLGTPSCSPPLPRAPTMPPAAPMPSAAVPPNYPVQMTGPPAANTRAPQPRTPRLPGGRPDPRYRQPRDFAELQAVAGEVAKSIGRPIRWSLSPGENPGPLVSIGGGLDQCNISIHPVAARQVPPNTWAFLFGHEFAHLAEYLGTAAQTTPAKELKADIAGARYAMAAGYRVEAFLGWVLTQPDQASVSHGSLRHRVNAIAAHFGIPQSAIQAQAQRYSNR